MQYLYTFLVPALAAVVKAQSAPDFPIQVQTNLRVDFVNSSTSVKPAGVLLPRSGMFRSGALSHCQSTDRPRRTDVFYAPTVYGPQSATQQATYMLFMIDQDVNTGSGPRVELLHLFQPNLVGGGSQALSVQISAKNATTAVGAEYVTPSPPGGDGPHRYTLLLYPQPANFAVPQAFASFSPPADLNARYPFNMTGFAEAAGLGQPIAANWFRVVNDTTDATSSSSSSLASGSATASATSAATSSASSAASAAGLVEVGGSTTELVVGCVMAVAGAWMWML